MRNKWIFSVRSLAFNIDSRSWKCMWPHRWRGRCLLRWMPLALLVFKLISFSISLLSVRLMLFAPHAESYPNPDATPMAVVSRIDWEHAPLFDPFVRGRHSISSGIISRQDRKWFSMFTCVHNNAALFPRRVWYLGRYYLPPPANQLMAKMRGKTLRPTTQNALLSGADLNRYFCVFILHELAFRARNHRCRRSDTQWVLRYLNAIEINVYLWTLDYISKKKTLRKITCTNLIRNNPNHAMLTIFRYVFI